MKKTFEKITADFMEHAQSLRTISFEIARLERMFTAMSGELGKIGKNFETPEEIPVDLPSENPAFIELYREPCGTNVIPYPVLQVSEPNTAPRYRTAAGEATVIPFPAREDVSPDNEWIEPVSADVPIQGGPGKLLPVCVADFRPHLQRDGLLLLAWDMRMTAMGECYTAYWVTSSGTPRFYASTPFSAEEVVSARPHHKSYAAEDGIEFYDQKAPAYIVHVAPELMMSNPSHKELREIHIKLLKHLGSSVDFDYKYLLSTDKAKAAGKTQGLPLTKPAGSGGGQRAGA